MRHIRQNSRFSLYAVTYLCSYIGATYKIPYEILAGMVQHIS